MAGLVKVGSQPFFRMPFEEWLQKPEAHVVINGIECVYTCANYHESKDPKYDGFFPVYTAERDDRLGDTPDVLTNLYNSFERGDFAHGSKADAMPMDIGHGSLFGITQKEASYITQMDVWAENTDGTCAVATYDPSGNRVARTPLGQDGVYLCGKLAIPLKNLEDIIGGEYGKKFSVAFTMDRPETLINVAWVQNPAKDAVPVAGLRSASGLKIRTRECGLANSKNFKPGVFTQDEVEETTETKGKDMEKDKGQTTTKTATKSAVNVRVTDEALKQSLHDVLVSLGGTEEEATGACDAWSDSFGQKMLEVCQNFLTPPDDGNGDGSATNSTTNGKKSKDVEEMVPKSALTAMQKQIDNLQEQFRNSNPQSDPKYAAAYAALTKGKVNPAKADQMARKFLGSSLKSEEVTSICEELVSGYNPPATGSATKGIDIKEPVGEGQKQEEAIWQKALDQAAVELPDGSKSDIDARARAILREKVGGKKRSTQERK